VTYEELQLENRHLQYIILLLARKYPDNRDVQEAKRSLQEMDCWRKGITESVNPCTKPVTS
jgi:hypothetical protein